MLCNIALAQQKAQPRYNAQSAQRIKFTNKAAT